VRTASRFWPPFFLLVILEGIAALIALASIPGEGISVTRLMLYGSILGPMVVAGGLFYFSRKEDWCARTLDPFTRPRLFYALSVIASLLLLTSSLLLFLLRFLRPEATLPLFERARPTLVYFSLLSAQFLLWTLILRRGFHGDGLRQHRSVLQAAGMIFAGFLLLWGLVALSGLGVTPDASYWSEPGVPLLGWQVVVTLLVGWGAAVFLARQPAPRKLDLWLSLGLWLLAVVLWGSVPLETLRNSFYAPITPPLNQPLPASDAAYYDSNAQSLLVGWGYIQPIPSRPLFIVFLAGLHALLGQEYSRLALAQTLLFALLPVGLYWLGRLLHSRVAGGMVALLAILREWNSLWVASEVRVSNSKMFLSEFVTTLALIAYLVLVIRWLRRKPPHPMLAFAAGGVLGWQLLLRTQVASLAPGMVGLALLVFWPDWKRWAQQAIGFGLGLMLAISPWLMRNLSHTGQALLDDPMQVKVVASMYSGGTPTSNLARFEGQSPQEIGRFVIETILQRPGYVAGFVANHFFANLIDTVLVLPIVARYDGLLAPIYPYWYEWRSYLSPANIALWGVYLAAMALGLAAVWKRFRWVGLAPLVAFILYIGSTSLARYSGWRYVFPVDWLGYFFLSLGAAEGMVLVASLFGKDLSAVLKPLHPSPPLRLAGRSGIVLGLAGGILVVGSLPWLAESLPPQAELPCRADEVLPCLVEQGFAAEPLADFLAQPAAVVLQGRLLYPRYFSRNDGLSSTNPMPAYAPRPFPRLGFLLLTPESLEQVVLPIRGARSLPAASDIVLFGCRRQGYVEAKVVLVIETRQKVVGGVLEEGCPAVDGPSRQE